MWQRFTERARKTVYYAQEEAQRFGEWYVSTEHLLLGLTRDEDSTAARVLRRLGIGLEEIRFETEKQLPRSEARPSQDMTLTPMVKRCIDLAYKEAKDLGNCYIGTEHLLLGLVDEGDGLAARVLTKLGLHLLDVREAVAAIQAEDIETGSVVTPQRPPIPPKATAPAPSPRNLDALLLLIRQNVAVPALVLLIAIADEENMARELLSRLGINYQSLQYDIEAGLINRTLPRSAITLDQILQAANQSASERGRPMNSGDLLLAVLQLDAPYAELKEIGFEKLRDELNRMRS